MFYLKWGLCECGQTAGHVRGSFGRLLEKRLRGTFYSEEDEDCDRSVVKAFGLLNAFNGKEPEVKQSLWI